MVSQPALQIILLLRSHHVSTHSSDNLIPERRVMFDGGEDVAVTVVDVIAKERGNPSPRSSRASTRPSISTVSTESSKHNADGTTRNGWGTFVLCDCIVRLHSDGRLLIFDCTDGLLSG